MNLLHKVMALLFLLSLTSFAYAQTGGKNIVIGSKMDNESYILSEITAQLLENNGFIVERKFGLGGTFICYNALQEGEIDIYPEYTGTLLGAILTEDERPKNDHSVDAYSTIMASKGLDIFAPYGFNNTYALAIKKNLSEERSIHAISDIQNHPDLIINFSNEFLSRDDGWPKLKTVYGLNFSPSGIQHGLAYKAIDEGSIDITDAYSTDGDIERYGLILLEDDLEFFPEYLAASLVRLDFPQEAKKVILQLENILDDDKMRKLNAAVVIDQRTFSDVANQFLNENGLLTEDIIIQEYSVVDQLINNTITHIKLTLIALSIGCFIGLLVAFLVFRSSRVSRYVIYITGLLQTIPSIALLALMIPLLGIGEVPAITALFLYSLLPILRSAVTALSTIDPILTKVSRAIGMTKFQQLRYVLFPLALPNILAGIKTATIICIGTATLAAFIGAGGLGEPIVTGLALNDTNLILQGAIPAACLAIIVELLFEVLEKFIVPAHMRT